MSITFSNISQASFNQAQCVCQGDGAATTLTLDLSAAPWAISFNGTVPSAASIATQSALVGTGVITTNPGNGHVILTITFNSAPPAAVAPPGNTTFGLLITFVYSG